jgi:phosphoribosylamine---glycine ligase
VCIVMAAGGYPAAYAKGREIRGLDRAAALAGVVVFHAGTQRADGAVVTSGGRVLGVTARGATFVEAAKQAYVAAARIKFQDAHYRTDIARRALVKRS